MWRGGRRIPPPLPPPNTLHPSSYPRPSSFSSSTTTIITLHPSSSLLPYQSIHQGSLANTPIDLLQNQLKLMYIKINASDGVITIRKLPPGGVGGRGGKGMRGERRGGRIVVLLLLLLLLLPSPFSW